MCDIRRVPIDLLSRDPLNPRDEPPTDELINSVRANGILLPLTARSDGNGGFYVGDGWERVQAALKVGIDDLLIEIHPDELSSMRAGHAKSNVRSWTKYEHIVDVNNYYRVCRDKERMHHSEALHKTANDLAKNKATVERYVRIWKLPDGVKILFKTPSKRTRDEWNYLLKFNKNIRRYNETLSTVLADHLMKYIHEVPEERLVDIACNIIGKKKTLSKQIISEATRPYNLNKPIRDIFNMVKTGCDKPTGLNLPSQVYLPPENKQRILMYMANRRMKINEFIRYLFDDFVATLQKENGD